MAPLALNDVWRETAQRVERQAGVLFIVAAAFLMLPAVILYLAHPEIAEMGGRSVTPAEVRRVLPGLLLSSFVQLFGQLGLIAIATDSGRSTIGVALHHAFGSLPRVILAFLVLAAGLFATMFLAALVVGVPLMMATGGATLDPRRLSSLIVLGLAIPCLYFGVRFSLFTVVAVAERAGAIESLKASWHSTRGHVFAILLIVMLSLIGLFALQGLVSLVAGGAGRLIDTMTGGSGVPRFLAQLFGGAVGAVASTYFTMLLVVIRRRLTLA